MLDFRRLAGGLFVLYKNGERVTGPVTKSGLVDALVALPLTQREVEFIERVYGG